MWLSSGDLQQTKSHPDQPLEPESSSFTQVAASVRGTLTFGPPGPLPASERWWADVTPGGVILLTQLTLRQREEEQSRRECDWHLIFCTDFTRSVPLGSQFGNALSRRSLSSPYAGIIPETLAIVFLRAPSSSFSASPSSLQQRQGSTLPPRK